MIEEFGRFFATSYPQVLGGAILALRDRDLARDATDEAFARAWAHWRRVRKMDGRKAWVSRVAFNYALSVKRSRKAQPLQDVADEPIAKLDEGAELRAYLRQLLGELSPQQRMAVVLRYYFDLTVRETAKWLGISEGAVKGYCAEAKRRLERLGGWEVDRVDTREAVEPLKPFKRQGA